MARHQDWFMRLTRVILDHHRKPFVWGENDCCLFASACVDAMVGSMHRHLLRNRYRCKATASEYLRASGGYIAAISEFIGEPSKSRRRRTGDVVLFEHKRGELACGVVFGPFIAATAATGVTFVLRRRIFAHWAI